MADKQSTEGMAGESGTPVVQGASSTGAPPIKGSITITRNADGSYTLDPPTGVLDRNIQFMQWSLVAPGYQFAPDGIIVNRDPAKGTPWPGEDPVRENDWQYRANVRYRVPHGQPPQTYHWDFKVDQDFDSSQSPYIDPDMENQPEP